MKGTDTSLNQKIAHFDIIICYKGPSTLSIMAFSKMTLSVMTLNAMTFRVLLC
jgi:hypothetical protein